MHGRKGHGQGNGDHHRAGYRRGAVSSHARPRGDGTAVRVRPRAVEPQGRRRHRQRPGHQCDREDRTAGGGTRWFNGYVTRFSQVGMHGRYHAYRASIRPWLWFMTRRTNCRIFQELTVPEIIKKIFDDYSIADFSLDGLTDTYPKRRVLRPVPRDRLQFRLAADGGGGDLLLLQACRRQAHSDAGRFLQRARPLSATTRRSPSCRWIARRG
ncbi:MAG: contractile injection system protein, VgrG/Pvc8 family [Desulfobacterales bacterium]|nr:contractile injection system protein, VgrG/Pvc8 family [Desulfobacterales bacterium]